MKKLSNIETDFKKSDACKKACNLNETDKLVYWTCSSKVQPQDVA